MKPQNEQLQYCTDGLSVEKFSAQSSMSWLKVIGDQSGLSDSIVAPQVYEVSISIYRLYIYMYIYICMCVCCFIFNGWAHFSYYRHNLKRPSAKACLLLPGQPKSDVDTAAVEISWAEALISTLKNRSCNT